MSNKIYSILYAVMSAVSVILMQDYAGALPPTLVMFICSLFASIYFHIVNIHKVQFVYAQARMHKWLWLSLNLSIAITWLAIFYCVRATGPFAAIFLDFTVGAVVAYGFLLAREKKIKSIFTLSAVGLICTLLFFIWEHSASQHYKIFYYGTALGIVSGIAGFFYNKISYEFTHATALTSTQVLALRYFLMLVVTGIFALPHFSLLLSFHALGVVLLMTAVSFILPIYFNQIGIIKAGAEHHSIIIAITPFLTFIFEFLIYRVWVTEYMVMSALTFLFISVPYFISYYQHRHIEEDPELLQDKYYNQ